MMALKIIAKNLGICLAIPAIMWMVYLAFYALDTLMEMLMNALRYHGATSVVSFMSGLTFLFLMLGIIYALADLWNARAELFKTRKPLSFAKLARLEGVSPDQVRETVDEKVPE